MTVVSGCVLMPTTSVDYKLKVILPLATWVWPYQNAIMVLTVVNPILELLKWCDIIGASVERRLQLFHFAL